MTERVASDTPGVEHVEGTVERHGATTRLRVGLPTDAPLTAGDVVRLVLDDTEYFTRPTETTEGIAIVDAAETPALARDPDGDENHLVAWLDDRALAEGRTVHLDVVVEGYRYGLRAPGERAVYDATEPDRGLASIARDLTGRD